MYSEVHLISLSDALEIENSYGNQILNIWFNCICNLFLFFILSPEFLGGKHFASEFSGFANRLTKNVVVSVLRKIFWIPRPSKVSTNPEAKIFEVDSIAFVLNFNASPLPRVFLTQIACILYHHFIFSLIIEGHRKSPVVSFGWLPPPWLPHLESLRARLQRRLRNLGHMRPRKRAATAQLGQNCINNARTPRARQFCNTWLYLNFLF